MDYEMVSTEEYDELPEDDEQCWVAVEAICRRKMTQMMEEDQRSADYYAEVRAHYMAAVYSAARQCRILNIPDPHVSAPREVYDLYSTFALAVQGEVARIRVQNRRARGGILGAADTECAH